MLGEKNNSRFISDSHICVQILFMKKKQASMQAVMMLMMEVGARKKTRKIYFNFTNKHH